MNPPVVCVPTLPNPVPFSISARWAMSVSSAMLLFKLKSLFTASTEDSTAAPLMPKPYPNGRDDVRLIVIGKVVIRAIDRSTVGNVIGLPLKTILEPDGEGVTLAVTPLSTVQPTPVDPAFVISVFVHALNMKLRLAGQYACAWIMVCWS